MNKQDNKLAISVIATLTAGIALIYTLIMYRTIIFAVAGVSIIFLVTSFILTQNIIAFVTMKNKSMNVHIKNCVDDISSQLEAINGVQTQLGKATYIYTKQAAQKVATLENNYAESQAALYKNLASISSRQNKATKLMIKSDQNNTVKLIASIRDIRNKLNETMITGFDQIQPNNTEIINVLESIADYLKNQADSYEQTLGQQLNNVANELQNISNNIHNVQTPADSMMQPVPDTPVSDIPVSVNYSEQPEVLTAEITQDIPIDDIPSEDMLTNDILSEDISSEDVPTEDILSEDIPSEDIPSEDIPTEDILSEEIPSESSKDEDLTEDTKIFEENITKDTPATDPEDVAEDTVTEAEQQFTPTFTVVGKNDDNKEQTAPADIHDDSNKQLSPEEIAALFASSEPTPKKEPAHTNETPVKASLDDSNKQLSPEEIAALFASSEPTPKKEPAHINEPSVETSLDDSNKQLSPEEIAALFASSEPTPKKEPAHTNEPSVKASSDDSNKQLSPEEIAALFASMG